MDNTPINLGNILEQAPNWTFAGDFSLFQWMTQISQDLESRAVKTTDALKKLNHNVKSTNIALDNVSNSLTALQFGNQFVECRVQDDDETINNTNMASGIGNADPTEQTPTSKEMLNIFLNNNLKVLRNCHEKYAIDLDDSCYDNIQGKPEEKTCIYQPINPYNQRPLPYIYGSKDWLANWHVGLYEDQQENSYSGDEISEVFSESSSTSRLGDNESLESNTEWASSISVDNENLMTNIENRNASSLRDSQQICRGIPSVPISAAKTNVTISESSSLSTPSSSLAKKPIQVQRSKEHLSKRSESINSLESKNSQKISSKVPSYSKENSLNFISKPPPLVDLFAEPPEDIQSTTSSSVSLAQNVNDIPDVSQKAEYSRNKQRDSAKSATLRHPSAPFVDLFAEPPSDILPSTSSSASSGFNIKRKTVNLFDDDELDDGRQNDLLSSIRKNNESDTTKTIEKKLLPVIKTPKTLFDDSDEDDFLKEFVSKQSAKETPKNTLTKALLLDDDINESSNTLKEKTNDIVSSPANNTLAHVKENGKNITSTTPKGKDNIKNVFDDINDTEDDSFFSKNVKQQPIHNITKVPINADETVNKSINHKDPHVTTIENKSKLLNLFDDKISTEDDLLFGRNIEKDSKKLVEKSLEQTDSEIIKDFAKEKDNLHKTVIFDGLEEDLKGDNSKLNKPIKKTKLLNIFGDLDEEEGDDLFFTKPKQTISDSNASSSSLSEANISQEKTKKPLESVKEKLDIPFKQTDFEENKPEVLKPIDNLKTYSKTNESSSVFQSTDIPKEINKSELEDSGTFSKEKLKEFKNKTNLESKLECLGEQSALGNKEHDKNKISGILQNEQFPDKSNFLTTESKYGFSSVLFMDEPPEDDNDFFDTLTSVNPTNITTYNVIDLENELYEPELPKVPAVETNNLTNTPDTQNSTTYTGLQLFSDIPPDDDNNNEFVYSGPSKRLHGVFYDDFSETLEALHSNGMPKAALHSVFSNEPPPKNKDSNQNKVQQNEIPSEESKHNNVENANAASSAKRPVSKLLMPNININVQALLPGGNNTNKRKNETSNLNSEANNDNLIYSAAVPSDDKVSKNEIIPDFKEEIKTYARTAETKHILPNITKNRVKAPATRRPSTRKARQENYRKSLIEEQNILASEDVSTNQDNVTPMNTHEQLLNKDNKTSSLVSVLPELNTSTKTNSATLQSKIEFNNKNEEIPKNLALADADTEAKSKSLQINAIEENKNNLDFSKKNQNFDNKPSILTKTLLFEDESDDDLFNNIKALKSAKKEDKLKATATELVPEQSCSQIIEETTEIPKIANLQVTKEVSQSVLVDKKHDSVIEKSVSFQENRTTLPASNVTETKNKISNPVLKPAVNKTTSSSLFFDDEDNTEDDFFRPITTQKLINQNKQKDLNLAAKTEFKSFLDSESEEEKNLAGLSTTISDSKKTTNKSNMIMRDKSHKLFSESDTDSDDLFGKLTSTKTSNVTKHLSKHSTESTKKSLKIPPKTFLFSDESDDDNNDAFKTTEKSIKKTISKPSELKSKTKLGTQGSTSLFSDIDSDENDLFGSTATASKSKPPAANITTTTTPTTSKQILSEISKTSTHNSTKAVDNVTTEISKTTTTVADNNPLADLL